MSQVPLTGLTKGSFTETTVRLDTKGPESFSVSYYGVVLQPGDEDPDLTLPGMYGFMLRKLNSSIGDTTDSWFATKGVLIYGTDDGRSFTDSAGVRYSLPRTEAIKLIPQ